MPSSTIGIIFIAIFIAIIVIMFGGSYSLLEWAVNNLTTITISCSLAFSVIIGLIQKNIISALAFALCFSQLVFFISYGIHSVNGIDSAFKQTLN